MEIESQPQELVDLASRQAEQEAAEDESIIEGLKALGSSGEDQSTEEAAEEAADPGQDDSAEEAEPAEAEGEDADTLDDEAGDEGEKAVEAEEPDPQIAKNLEAIQRAEAKAKEAAARMIEEAKAEVAKLREGMPSAEELKAFEQFKQIQNRAKYDPASALAALGVDLHEDGELVARQVYSLSKAAADNPRSREAAQASLRTRETLSRLEQLEKRNQELERKMQEQAEAVRYEQQAKEYMGGLSSSVTADDAPLLARKMQNSQSETQQLLAQAAISIAEETGETPEYADVITRVESQLKKELNSLGIDPESILTPKQKNQVAGEKKAAKSLSNELSPPTKPRAEPKSEEELDAEIIRELAKMSD